MVPLRRVFPYLGLHLNCGPYLGIALDQQFEPLSACTIRPQGCRGEKVRFILPYLGLARGAHCTDDPFWHMDLDPPQIHRPYDYYYPNPH